MARARRPISGGTSGARAVGAPSTTAVMPAAGMEIAAFQAVRPIALCVRRVSDFMEPSGARGPGRGSRRQRMSNLPRRSCLPNPRCRPPTKSRRCQDSNCRRPSRKVRQPNQAIRHFSSPWFQTQFRPARSPKSLLPCRSQASGPASRSRPRRQKTTSSMRQSSAAAAKSGSRRSGRRQCSRSVCGSRPCVNRPVDCHERR